MRLIDADKLYDWVRRECNPYGKPTIDFESGNRMLDMIKRSSTAFDKEKVIDIIARANSAITVGDKNKALYWMKKLEEIVEKGGIE